MIQFRGSYLSDERVARSRVGRRGGPHGQEHEHAVITRCRNQLLELVIGLGRAAGECKRDTDRVETRAAKGLEARSERCARAPRTA